MSSLPEDQKFLLVAQKVLLELPLTFVRFVYALQEFYIIGISGRNFAGSFQEALNGGTYGPWRKKARSSPVNADIYYDWILNYGFTFLFR